MNIVFYGIIFFIVFCFSIIGCSQKLGDGSTINTTTTVSPHLQLPVSPLK